MSESIGEENKLSKVTRFLTHTERPKVLTRSRGTLKHSQEAQQLRLWDYKLFDGLHNKVWAISGSFLVIGQGKQFSSIGVSMWKIRVNFWVLRQVITKSKLTNVVTYIYKETGFLQVQNLERRIHKTTLTSPSNGKFQGPQVHSWVW